MGFVKRTVSKEMSVLMALHTSKEDMFVVYNLKPYFNPEY